HGAGREPRSDVARRRLDERDLGERSPDSGRRVELRLEHREALPLDSRRLDRTLEARASREQDVELARDLLELARVEPPEIGRDLLERPVARRLVKADDLAQGQVPLEVVLEAPEVEREPRRLEVRRLLRLRLELFADPGDLGEVSRETPQGRDAL